MKHFSPGAPGMTEQVNNHDNGNLPTILVALLLNMIAPWATWIPAVPEWMLKNVGFVVTGLVLFVTQKAVGKWMDRRWPDRRRKPGDSQN